MKKLMLAVVMLGLSVAARAQGDAITKFFDKYKDDDSFTQVTVSSKMFNLFTNMEVKNKDDQDVLNAISKLKGLRVLAKEQGRNSRELYKEALAQVPMKEYEELMSVRDKDKDMKFFIKESKPGLISELVMVAGGNEEFMMLTLFGEIDLKEISNIGSKMNIGGLDQLKKMNKDNPKEAKESKETSNSKDSKKNEE
ncbi:hypothetical protein BH09BAC3_BH09BAC3_04230 [soil metagenome]